MPHTERPDAAIIVAIIMTIQVILVVSVVQQFRSNAARPVQSIRLAVPIIDHARGKLAAAP